MEHEKSDVYRRYLAMKHFAEGKPTQEDIDFVRGRQVEEYGPSETFPREEFGTQRFRGTHRGELRTYVVRSDGAWINGAGIRIDDAYRVVSEDDKTITVQRVLTGSELEGVKLAMMDEIHRILAKSREERR